MIKQFIAMALVLFTTACATQPKAHFEQAEGTSIAQYKTFSIEKLDVKGLHPDAMVKVGKAVKQALEQKGLSFVWEDGDITVQYAVGVKSVQNLVLKHYPVGNQIYTGHLLEDNYYATMILYLVDEEAKKQVWMMSGSKRIDNLDSSQEQVNQTIQAVFENLK